MTPDELSRISNSPGKQVSSPSRRRALLDTLQQVDLVQTVDRIGNLSPPTMIWRIAEGRIFEIEDYAKSANSPYGWAHHKRRFNADGHEVDEHGQALEGGRVLVMASVTPQAASEIREAQFRRWTDALDADAKNLLGYIPPRREWPADFNEGEYAEKCRQILETP